VEVHSQVLAELGLQKGEEMMNEPKTYTSSTGVTYTDDDIEQWAAAAESGQYPGRPGPVIRGGRPLTVGEATSTPFTVRLDPARRSKVEETAHVRNTTAAQVLRDLIDSLE